MNRSITRVFFALLVAGSASAQVLVPRDGGSPIAVRSQHVEAIVQDGIARTKVRHTFVNPGTRPLEAVYSFPLPEGAALMQVAMEVGGERFEGLLAERKRARRVYDDIVRQKRDPALVEQIGRSSFRLSVFPVVPAEETVVELAWIQRVPLTGSAFRYVYPLGAAGSEPVEQDVSLTVRLRSAVPFTRVEASRSDVQIVRHGPREALAALEITRGTLEGDLVVTAAVETPEPSLVVETYRGPAGDGWFLATITPPPAREDQLVPRDVTLVIDTSGSMAEDGKLEQARASALWLLENLRPADRVNVLRFSSDVQAFAAAPVPATPEHLAQLKRFVAEFTAIGGTALGDALRTALSVPLNEGRAQMIVLLTDGKPTIGEEAPRKLVELARSNGTGQRVFPFGVGTDVDSALLRGIAAAARGRAEIFRPGGEIRARLTTFLKRTSAPVIANLVFSVDGPAVHDVLPRPIPDAYLGEQVAIVGRYRGAGPGTVTVSAHVGGAQRQLTAKVDFPATAGGSPSVKHLFAREKLDHLESARQLRLGLSDEAYYAAMDRGAYSTADEIVREMVTVSVEHGVQCAATAFLVLLPQDRARLAGTADADVSIEDGSLLEQEPVLEEMEITETQEFEDSPFDSRAFNDVIGVGGGAGGSYGRRSDGRRNLRAAGGSGTEQGLKDGLEWLKAKQRADGSWPGASERGEGDTSDVGSTALALLAFLGDGSTLTQGPYRKTVLQGVKWLRDQQNGETRRIGADTDLRAHALATLTLCEAYTFSKSPLVRRTVQGALEHLVREQDPSGAWRSGSAAGLDADLQVTGWALLALFCAQDAGLAVDETALQDGLAWLATVTEAEPARPSGAALLCRILAGQTPADSPALLRIAEAILSEAPSADSGASGLSADDWFFRTCAMYQMGGQHWKRWHATVRQLLLESQRKDAGAKGSWDPASAGGRVAATATAGLCLEVSFRLLRVLR